MRALNHQHDPIGRTETAAEAPPTAYLRKHALTGPLIAEAPAEALALVVVIPSHDEPGLLETLRSLLGCAPPQPAVEVLVVFNHSVACGPEVKARNRLGFEQARAWSTAHERPWLRFHCLWQPDLPPRHAGVGLARKLGMDEAVRRLQCAGGNPAGDSQGVIVALDADCTVRKDYLWAIWQAFQNRAPMQAASIAFEHPWQLEPDPLLRQGIVQYELYLRFYVNGLRWAGYPYHFHTVGSAMAVRADAYQQQGGMNRRKAAEDFYFLGKFMPLGRFGVINKTRVFPSCRISHRVPFGTGRSQDTWRKTATETLLVEPPAFFADLGKLVAAIPDFLEPANPPRLPASIAAFLEAEHFAGRLAEIRANCASPAAFQTRFLRWLDRFRVLKLAHFHAREGFAATQPVTDAARKLLEGSPALEQGQISGWTAPHDPQQLLSAYRSLDMGAPE